MPAKKAGQAHVTPQPPLPPAGQKRRQQQQQPQDRGTSSNRGASVASPYGVKASSAASSVDNRAGGGISRRRRGEGEEGFSPTTGNNTAAQFNDSSSSLFDEFAFPNNNININTNIISTAVGAGGRGSRGGRAGGGRGNNFGTNSVKKSTLANAPIPPPSSSSNTLDYSSISPRYDTTVYEAPVTTPGPSSLLTQDQTMVLGGHQGTTNNSRNNKKERAVLVTSDILPSCLPSPLPFLRRMVDIRFLDKLFVTPQMALAARGGGGGPPAMKAAENRFSSAAVVKESLRILTNDDDDEAEEEIADCDGAHQFQQRKQHLGDKRGREEMQPCTARHKHDEQQQALHLHVRELPSTLPSPAAAVQALQSGITFGSYCVALASVVTAAEVHTNHLRPLAFSLKGERNLSSTNDTSSDSDTYCSSACGVGAAPLTEELADLLKACEEAYRLAMLPLSDACEGRGRGRGPKREGGGGQNHNADLSTPLLASSAEVPLPFSSPRSSSSFLLLANVLLAMKKLHQVDLLIRNCAKRDGEGLLLTPTTELFRFPSAHGVNNAAARNFIKARAAKLNLLYRSSEEKSKQQQQQSTHTSEGEKCLTISLSQEREGVAVVLTNTCTKEGTECRDEQRSGAITISTTRGDSGGPTFTSLWEVAWRLWPAANISVSSIDSHWLVSDRARYVRNNQDIVLATSPAAAARHSSSTKHLSAAHHLSVLGISTASAAEVLTQIRGEVAHDLPFHVHVPKSTNSSSTSSSSSSVRKAVPLPIQTTALIGSYCPQQQHQHEFFIPPKAHGGGGGGGGEEDGLARLGGSTEKTLQHQHLPPTPPEPSIAVETQANLEYSHRTTILQNDVYRSLLTNTKLSVAFAKTLAPDEEGNKINRRRADALPIKSDTTNDNVDGQQTSTIELPITVTYSNSFSSIRNCAVAAHGPSYELLTKLFANYCQSMTKSSEHPLFSLSPADERRPMPSATKRRLAVFSERLINNAATTITTTDAVHKTSTSNKGGGSGSGPPSHTFVCGPPSVLALSTDDRLVLETKISATSNSSSSASTDMPMVVLINSYVDNGRREIMRNILVEVEAEDGLPRYMRYVNRIQQEEVKQKTFYHSNHDHHCCVVDDRPASSSSLLGGVVSSVEGMFPTPLDLPMSYFPLLKQPHLLFGVDTAALTSQSPNSSSWANYEQGIQQEIIDIFTDRIWGLGSRNGAVDDDTHRHRRQQPLGGLMARVGNSGRPPPRLIYPVLISAPAVAAMRLLMQLTSTRSGAEEARAEGGAQTLLDALCCFLKDKAADLGLFGNARRSDQSPSGGSSSSPFGPFAAEALLASTYQPPSSHPSGFHLVVDLDSALVALLGEGPRISLCQAPAAADASPLEKARVRVHEHVYASTLSLPRSSNLSSSNFFAGEGGGDCAFINHHLIDTPTTSTCSYGFVVFFHSFTDTKHLSFYVAATIEM